jgi:hypothetical protein
MLIELKKDKDAKHFPFRYLYDDKNQIIPVVMVSGFFREKSERERFERYKSQGVKMVGITAYKTFPKPIRDPSENTTTDDFNYLREIQHWFCCFKRSEEYGLTAANHRLKNISESDFYDAETTVVADKKYDFIYVCLRDSNDETTKKCSRSASVAGAECCPATGWNAVNRNFELAKACFPIMIEEMGFRGLVVGRVNCGLEALYGDRLTVMDFLPYHEFQQKIRESHFLFVPNVLDASPRVVSEALIKDVPVLINSNIVCGSKYIHEETGVFFTNEKDIRPALTKMKLHIRGERQFTPQAWWKKNHSCKKAAKQMCAAMKEWFPEVFKGGSNGVVDSSVKDGSNKVDCKEIYFYK